MALTRQETAQKTYVCNRYPGLSIGNAVKFEGGLFTAKNKAEQEIVESSDWYGLYIVDRDTVEEIAADSAEETEALRLAERAEREGSRPRIRQGRVGTL